MELPAEDIATLPVATAQQTPPQEPTKTVGTFWDRLDQVLQLNLEAAKMREQVEGLLEEFPSFETSQRDYKSALFQPERIALSSSDDANTLVAALADTGGGTEIVESHRRAESFSNFRIRFQKALRNVKGIQLISASIPNAVTNIPDNQCIFFYYRLRTLAAASLGAWNSATQYNPGDIVTFNTYNYVCIAQPPSPGFQPIVTQFWKQITLPGDLTRPNYYDLNPNYIQWVFLIPTNYFQPERYAPQYYNTHNRTFQSYADLVASLSASALGTPLPPAPIVNAQTASIPNDISFTYDATLNRIIFIPFNTGTYYYIPCGYEDPNLDLFIAQTLLNPQLQYWLPLAYKSGYTLNSRCGFTWNGVFPNPVTTDPYATNTLRNCLFNYMRPVDPGFPASLQWNEDVVVAQSYPDLVYSSVCRIYTDVVLGSSEDSKSDGNLLAIVPVNTNNLGVAFYQSAYQNFYTKIPENIAEMNIRLVTDAGDPFYLPNSATVNLEIAVLYK